MATVTFSAADDLLYAYLAGEIDHDAAQNPAHPAGRCAGQPHSADPCAGFRRGSFMDSSGIGLILGRQRIARTLGTALRVQHTPSQLAKVLQLARIPCTDAGQKEE